MNINISISDFHHIFTAIQERYIRLEEEAGQMLRETSDLLNGIFEDEDNVKDPVRYAQLRKEISELKELNKRLYAETDNE